MKTNKLFGALFMLIVTMLVSSVTGLAAPLVGGGLYAASMFPKPKNVSFMALDVEIWKPWIVDTLFKDNQFLNFARNADEHVLAGSVVHIPQSGAASSIEKNRSSLPATVAQRTDTDITYNLDEYTSDPRLITDAETILSYNKMDSAMGQDMKAISQLVAEWMLYAWAPTTAARYVRTTGATSPAYTTDGTGVRKLLTLVDVKNAFKMLNKDNVPMDGRYMIMDADMYNQLLTLLDATTYTDFSKYFDAATGVVGKLYSFNIIVRSTALVYTSASPAVKKAPGAAGAATDHGAALFFHRDWVERAIGDTKIFEKVKDPTYYGDIYSLLIRAGGRSVETNSIGVGALIQETYT